MKWIVLTKYRIRHQNQYKSHNSDFTTLCLRIYSATHCNFGKGRYGGDSVGLLKWDHKTCVDEPSKLVLVAFNCLAGVVMYLGPNSH